MRDKVFAKRTQSIGMAVLLTAFLCAASPTQAADSSPKPLFSENEPVRPWQSLTNIALPNTTIDSVVTNADGSCRVTARVPHPPSGDLVKVFIALPLRCWFGRCEGTGGGGFS